MKLKEVFIDSKYVTASKFAASARDDEKVRVRFVVLPSSQILVSIASLEDIDMSDRESTFLQKSSKVAITTEMFEVVSIFELNRSVLLKNSGPTSQFSEQLQLISYCVLKATLKFSLFVQKYSSSISS